MPPLRTVTPEAAGSINQAQDFGREVGNNPLFDEPVFGRRRKRPQRLRHFFYVVTCVCRHLVGPLPGRGGGFATRFSANRKFCYLVPRATGAACRPFAARCGADHPKTRGADHQRRGGFPRERLKTLGDPRVVRSRLTRSISGALARSLPVSGKGADHAFAESVSSRW